MVLMMVNKIIDLCECCRSSNGLYRYRRWRGFWDAIWDSEVSITDFGCRDENLTLCDSKSESQTWGLNFMREIKRDVQSTPGTMLTIK
jgi:hypothetical protein